MACLLLSWLLNSARKTSKKYDVQDWRVFEVTKSEVIFHPLGEKKHCEFSSQTLAPIGFDDFFIKPPAEFTLVAKKFLTLHHK